MKPSELARATSRVKRCIGPLVDSVDEIVEVFEDETGRVITRYLYTKDGIQRQGIIGGVYGRG